MALDLFGDMEGSPHSCFDSNNAMYGTRNIPKKLVELKKGISRIKKIDGNKLRDDLEKFIIQIHEEKSNFLSPILFYPIINDIEKSFSIKFSEDIEKILSRDSQLLLALNDIKNNFGTIKHINFKIEDISFVTDPDEPDSSILTIYINIREENIKKLIEKRDNIIEELCKNLDIETDEKISIVNIFN